MAVPSIQVPAVPADAESRAGTTKADLISYVMELLAGAEVINYPDSEASSVDDANLQARVEALEQSFTEAIRPIRRVTKSCANAAETLFTFEDIGTEDYVVMIIAIHATTDQVTTNGRWHVVDGSKESTSVAIRFDGITDGATFEALIVPTS